EMRLIPLLLEMRLRGVRVDLEAAHRVKAELRRRIAEMQDGLKQAVGQHVDVWAAESVAAALRRVGYHNFPITPKTGAPSFRKEWLKQSQHPVVRAIAEIRDLDKLISTFIDGYILSKHR